MLKLILNEGKEENLKNELINIVKNFSPKIVKIASGYITLSGLKEILEILSNSDTSIQIVTFSENKSDFKKMLIGDLNGVPVDNSVIASIRQALGKMMLQVKIFSEKERRLHAKFFILENERKEKVVILGSSNLSHDALMKNIETNLNLKDEKVEKKLEELFQYLWENSEDVKDLILDLLKDLEFMLTELESNLEELKPIDFLKLLLYLKFGEPIESLKEERVLSAFQITGVYSSLEMIKRHSGAIIADSVGLGKSFIAAKILELALLYPEKMKDFFEKEIKNVTIILPPHLLPQWEDLLFSKRFFFREVDIKLGKNENYFWLVATLNNKTIKFLSLGIFQNLDKEEAFELLKDSDMIIIDEAHRFRNNQTKRFENLRNFLKVADCYKIFLTAAPVQNSILDVKNLILLISGNEGRGFLDGGNIYTIIRDFNREFINYKKNPREAERLESLKKEVTNILSSIIVRRTWDYILGKYAKNGKIKLGNREYIFKKPKPPVVVKYAENPPTKFGTFLDKCLKYLSEMSMISYKLFNPSVVRIGKISNEELEDNVEDENEEIFISLEKLIKLVIFKRLESSTFAFYKTLKEKIKRRNEIIENVISKEENKIYSKPLKEFVKDLVIEIRKELSKEFGEKFEIEEEIEEEIYFEEKKKKPEDYFVSTLFNLVDIKKSYLDEVKDGEKELVKRALDKLKSNLAKDRKISKNLIEDCEKFLNDGDVKLKKLKELLLKLKYELKQTADKKIIIFTQYRDTLDYLKENLEKFIKENANELPHYFSFDTGKAKIAIVHGELDPEEKMKQISLFSPRSNNYNLKKGEEEKSILLATDSVNEGINLQDAECVINYDLSWNPTTILQRIGRVARLGNEKEVFIYNFFPTDEIEATINLIKTLELKIDQIVNSVGKDLLILYEDEEIKNVGFEKITEDLAKKDWDQLEKEIEKRTKDIIGIDIESREEFLDVESRIEKFDLSLEDLIKEGKDIYKEGKVYLTCIGRNPYFLFIFDNSLHIFDENNENYKEIPFSSLVNKNVLEKLIINDSISLEDWKMIISRAKKIKDEIEERMKEESRGFKEALKSVIYSLTFSSKFPQDVVNYINILEKSYFSPVETRKIREELEKVGIKVRKGHKGYVIETENRIDEFKKILDKVLGKDKKDNTKPKLVGVMII